MLQKPTLRRSKVLREMASFKKRHKAHVNFNLENFAMQAEMKKKTISGWSMVKQPGDEEERYSGDERATQSPRGPQWNKLPHTHALTQTLPRLGAWSCICSGLMSHQKAGCDQRLGERENTKTHPPEMLIFLEPCAPERGLASQPETCWESSAWHLGWPHDCGRSENTWGKKPFAVPSPTDTTCRVTQPGITRKNSR